MKKRSYLEIENDIIEIINSIREYLSVDGGDLEFVNFDLNTGIVTIRALGACVGCPIIDTTYIDGVEQILVTNVDEVKGIKLIEGDN